MFNKIKISVKKLYSEKNKVYRYYIGYDDNDDIILLVIRLLQMIGYYKIFKNNKVMDFRCDDENLLKNMKNI